MTYNLTLRIIGSVAMATEVAELNNMPMTQIIFISSKGQILIGIVN